MKLMKMVRYPVFRSEYERCRESACAALGEEAFAAAYGEVEVAAAGASPLEAVNAILVS